MKHFFTAAALVFAANLFGQTATLEGYVFENANRGYLNQVKIQVFRLPENALVGETQSDAEGHFSLDVEKHQTYRVFSKKDVFFEKNDTAQLTDGKAFLKIELKRKPGYLFDVTLAERRTNDDEPVDAIQGATIEVYNRTTHKTELELKNHPSPGFQFTFEQGNKYTIMIRKQGYLTRRIEANVAVEGCIVCIDGVNDLRPGITENMTEGNKLGTLLANLDMEKVKLDRRIELKNIYYDYDKSFIRPDAAKELNKAVTLLADNPSISVELGSHTDSRGSDEYNLNLSQKRAESAVKYIIEHGIDEKRITAKGYGETQLVNRCANGVTCSEAEHQLNRRTELKITGVLDDPNLTLAQPTLAEIIHEEEFASEVKKLETQKEFRMPDAAGKPTEKPVAPKAERAKPIKEKSIKKTENQSADLPKQDLPLDIKVEQKNMETNEKTTVVEADADQFSRSETQVLDALKTKIIPKNYSGFAVEIAKSDLELEPSHPIFNQQKEVFMQKDDAGMFCYFIGNSTDQTHARSFYESVVVSKFPAARLVSFKNGVKWYSK